MALKLKLAALIVLLITTATLLTPQEIIAAEPDIQSALSACKNITAQQKQMAKAAGYDVESLCAAANQSTSPEVDTTMPVVVIPSETIVSPADRTLENLFKESNDAPDLSEDTELKVVDQTLQQYGYDLFEGSPTTFAPVTEIPVVHNYMIGPGDTIKIQLFGKTSESYSLTVSRDGTIHFPNLGPISLAGLTFVEMKALLIERISKQMIGVQASITLGELRSIRIFVLGDANRPGSYTVSSLSSMTNALFVSGGVRKIGSLRNIQLKRQGKVITSFDLYDLLLKGDTSKDVRLLPGDVIFIPPLGKTAGVAGEVKRPAIYELKQEKTASDLVALAGGYQPSAYPQASRIERISLAGDRTLIDLDLKTEQGASINLLNGDVLQIYSVLEKIENIVKIEGHVYRPGGFSYREGMRVSDLIGSISNLLPAPDLDYGLLIREMQPTREMLVKQVNLRSIFKDKNSEENLILQARDTLMIFSSIENREEALMPIIETLKNQEKLGHPTKVVTVSGSIHFSGEYPLTNGMSVQKLIFAGGGLKQSTYVSSAEITRKDYSNPEQASIKHFSIPLESSLSESNDSPVLLEPGDHLSLRIIPRYQEALLVTLQGEVKFPGEYEFIRGETLSDIVGRAGGLTSLSHVDAAFFTREDLKSKEEKKIAEFQKRLKADIAASQLEDVNSDKKTDRGSLNELLDDLESSEATGRLVINLSAILNHSVEDLQLRDGDRLIIPTFRQEITIIGEVQNPTSHLFNPVSDHLDYIDRSGGTTERADKNRIYVIKANGSVFLPEKRGWFHDDVTMSPGDTIVVPVETDRLDNITFWTSVSQIVYQMALGAAAIRSF